MTSGRLAVAAEQLKDRMKVQRARAKGRGRVARRIAVEEQFQTQLLKAGYSILPFYHNGVTKPSVVVDMNNLQDVIRGTRVRIEWSWSYGRKVRVWPVVTAPVSADTTDAVRP